MLLSERLDLPVFLKVGLARVLDIVIKGHDSLLRVVNLGGSHGHVAEYDRP